MKQHIDLKEKKMGKKKYSGVVVPLVTPFVQSGKVDELALERIVKYVCNNHCAPFVLGTTGEAASIAVEDFPGIASTMVKAAGNDCQTYAGISSNNFNTSVNLAKHMFDLGVGAVVAHPPCYYPISEKHILNYYEKLAENIKGPLLIYNIPATAHHSIPLDVIEKLSYHHNIVGVKDSERNSDRMKKSIELWSDRKDFVHLLGWGAELANALLLGSDGIVPSTGNLTPHLYNMMYEETISNNSENAQHLQNITDQFSKIYQQGRLLSDSLSGLKIMLSEINLCDKWVLPPLSVLNENEENTIIQLTQDLIESLKKDAFGERVIWP